MPLTSPPFDDIDAHFEAWSLNAHGDAWPQRIKKDEDGYLDNDTALRKQGWDAAMALVQESTAVSSSAVPNTTSDFETWWENHGCLCRSGGGDYEKTFAWNAWAHMVEQWQESIAETLFADEEAQELRSMAVMHKMVLNLSTD